MACRVTDLDARISHLRIGHDDIDVGSEDVTSAWHCLDYRLPIVTKGAANVTDALCNAIIADSDIRPNRLINRAAVEKTIGIF